MIQNGKHLNKFLSDIDILMSPLTEVIKILITSCHKLNIAINSISYDAIIKKYNAVFFFSVNSKGKTKTTKLRQK